MISPLPWKIDPEQDDSGIIRDANNEIIAEDYTFKNLDDFEAIPELIQSDRLTKRLATIKVLDQIIRDAAEQGEHVFIKYGSQITMESFSKERKPEVDQIK